MRGTRLAALVAACAAGSGILVPESAIADPPRTVGGSALAGSGTDVHAAPGVPTLPVIPAEGWLIADLDSGQVLAAHDAHGRFAPASTLKVLTALVLIPRLDPKAQLTPTSAEVAIDGTKVGAVPGHAYTVDMLLEGMLAVSGNDTARILAGALGGDNAVVALMNAEAARLHATDTFAATVTGLDAPNQTSSAYDLALLGQAALRNAAFRRYAASTRAQFAGTGVAPFAISNHNPLLGEYPGAYGVKNGYTAAARASYIGAAYRGGHHLVVTLIRADPAFRKPAEALLDWGFAADGKVDPVGVLVQPDATEGDNSAQQLAAELAQTLGVSGDPVARAASPGAVATVTVHRGSGQSSLTYAGIGAALGLAALVAVRRIQITRRRRRRFARRSLRLPPL